MKISYVEYKAFSLTKIKCHITNNKLLEEKNILNPIKMVFIIVKKEGGCSLLSQNKIT